jgi:disulfide bond formation protein DsbB
MAIRREVLVRSMNGHAERTIPAMILVASVMALVTIFVADFVYHLAPCTPCVYQRLPYLIVAFLALWAMVIPGRPRQQIAIAACGVLFALNAGLAAYHEGLQQGWWTTPDLCSEASYAASQFIGVFTMLTEKSFLSVCADVSVNIAGLSLTMLNFTYSAVMTLACTVAAVISSDPPEVGAH